jgi:hypothetical protein
MENVKQASWEDLFGDIDPIEATPDWNIEHYKKLLNYTKKTVKRNKVLQELKWWTDAKIQEELMEKYLKEKEER